MPRTSPLLNEADAPKNPDDRPLFLVIAIWAAGTLGLLISAQGTNFVIAAPKTWTWEAASTLVALFVMFYLGCLAFLSLTEPGRDSGRRAQAIVSMVVGLVAALLIKDGWAAFLMFLLLGFPMDFWGVTRR